MNFPAPPLSLTPASPAAQLGANGLVRRARVWACACAVVSPVWVAALVALAAVPEATAREYYGLSVVRLVSPEKAAEFDRAMESVFLPVLENAGIGPVGVFKAKGEAPAGGDPEAPVLRYILTRYRALGQIEEAREALVAHEGVDVAPALPYLMAEGKDDAAIGRIESWLLGAFEGFPEVAVPEGEAADRFFELRVYESPNELKGMAKVHMFDHGGELEIFEKVGLRGVFFGEALFAPNLPQLTYMLVYDSEEAKKSAWDGFRSSPDWAVLKDDERYAGTVSKIHSTDLVALPYSGIR